jgi:hypothetical protein
MLSVRRPALPAFLARRRLAIDWAGKPPAEGSRWWLVETCRAELVWAEADWRRIAGDGIDPPRGGWPEGPHPSEAWRLPHEVAAARLVNCHLHVDVAAWRMRELRNRLPHQRAAARDQTQGAAYRTAWTDHAASTLRDLQMHRSRRAGAWRGFLAATSHYCRLRATLDRTLYLQPAGNRAAA